jgi:hypothetical protein
MDNWQESPRFPRLVSFRRMQELYHDAVNLPGFGHTYKKELQAKSIPPNTIVDRWELEPGKVNGVVIGVKKRFSPMSEEKEEHFTTQGNCSDIASASVPIANPRFSTDVQKIAQAKKLCQTCPVQGDCLRSSMERADKSLSSWKPGSGTEPVILGRSDVGVWGGTTQKERWDLRRLVDRGLQKTSVVNPFNLIRALHDRRPIEDRVNEEPPMLGTLPDDPEGKNIPVEKWRSVFDKDWLKPLRLPE